MTTSTESDRSAVKLDWSRLLGFDQLSRAGDETAAVGPRDSRLTKLGGVKFGISKTGFTKVGGRRPDIVAVARAR